MRRRKKPWKVLTQSHSRFSRLNEVSSCEAFFLGWEQALLNPKARDFTDPEAFGVSNKVETNNYDLEHYISKENLVVDFAEKLHGEDSSIQEDDPQVSLPSSSNHLAKDQVESQSQDFSSVNPLELKGCLNVISSIPSTGSFDDNIKIDFVRPLLESHIPPNL